MKASETKPLGKGAIAEIDQQLARGYLLFFLENVPEFVRLWDHARAIPSQIIEALKPQMQEHFVKMSPAGRGAFIALQSPAFALHDENARAEAATACRLLSRIEESVQEVLSEVGVKHDYRGQLESLAEPLGVTGLVDLMIIRDAQEWGLDRLVYDAGPMEGPVIDLIKTETLGHLTDMGPDDLARETRSQIRRRMERKVGPLSAHLKRFHLIKRINLWGLHVVCGYTFDQIAYALQCNPGWSGAGNSPWAQVKKEVGEAARLLGVPRPSGAPRKGGLVRHWEMMAK
jgi:hypothetical protein